MAVRRGTGNGKVCTLVLGALSQAIKHLCTSYSYYDVMNMYLAPPLSHDLGKSGRDRESSVCVIKMTHASVVVVILWTMLA